MTDHYYHFIRINADGKPYLGYADNRIVTVGETITVEGEPILCEHGLHASARIIDALEYCPEGEVALCRVELGGTVIHGDDKSVASERTITAMLGAERTAALLQDFARWCALQVVDLWDAPDVVREYLTTGDETLRADAWLASEDALDAWLASADAWLASADAWLASERAVWLAAARAAREAAAEAASMAAAAARAVARSARSASIDAARAAQEAELQRLFHEAAEGGREP